MWQSKNVYKMETKSQSARVLNGSELCLFETRLFKDLLTTCL